MKKFSTKENLKLIDSYIINIVLLCIYLRALLFENIFVSNLVFALPLSYLAVRKYIWGELMLAVWIIFRLINLVYLDHAPVSEKGVLLLSLIILMLQIYYTVKKIYKSEHNKITPFKFLLYPATNGKTFISDIIIAIIFALSAFLLLDEKFTPLIAMY